MPKLPKLDRRRFLTALGVGSAGLLLPSLGRGPSRANAGDSVPTRVLFYVTPHGTVPVNWRMARMGENNEYSYDLAAVPEAEWSPLLRPLYRHRNKLLVLDGLSKATAAAEVYRVGAGISGDDANAHHVGQAHLLTCNWGMQRPGATVIGGARSLDNVIGDAVGVPGRWNNRVYGWNHQHPYSYVASGEPSPREQDPRNAFMDIMGIARPSAPEVPDRATQIDLARASVLDLAAGEYERVLPRLSGDDRQKLERHRQLVRDLELGLSGGGGVGAATCDPTFDATGNEMEDFNRIVALAFSCDLTRVVTYVTRNLWAEDFGAPPGVDVHQDIAHNSTPDADGYSPEREQQMTDYNMVYAEHFARLLDTLDSIPEAGETVLDHTAVVWMTEVGTGTHWLADHAHVFGGSACGFFPQGRYANFARTYREPNPWGDGGPMGPANNHLYVSLMNAMGMTDNSFGLTEIEDDTGARVDLTGPLLIPS